jgi:hypothetical protein
MDFDYTPFDVRVWVIFAAFVIATFLIVRIYHRMHPNYPESQDKGGDSKA